MTDDSTPSRRRPIRARLLSRGLARVLGAIALLAGGSGHVLADTGWSQRIIVRFADDAVPKSLPPLSRLRLEETRVATLGRSADTALTRLRETGGGALVLALPGGRPMAEVADLAARLAASPGVVWAEPDRRVRPFGQPDPWRPFQWNLRGPDSAQPVVGGANVESAWARSTGQGAVVAVIDSGRTDHPDLEGAWLPGYDLIAGDSAQGLNIAGDGDGRDPDPSDPGNWCESADASRPSTWHGTAVAGIIAARADNGYGIAGIAPAGSILPVRAIGRCGGYMSDVLDAMRWAVGLPVAGLPVNSTPARVLNVSLGGSVGTACSTYEQATVDELVRAGAVIVAAAGNDGTGNLTSPANCRDVLAVAAHSRLGDLAPYSNFHAGIALTAPGGTGSGETSAIMTSGNDGGTVPGLPLAARSFTGTSAAVPHVSAVAAMLLAAEPTLTSAAVRSSLVSTARPWPAGSRCAGGDAVGRCGAGMLDAAGALASLDNALSVTLTSPTASVPGGSEVVLAGAAASRLHGAGEIRYQWVQRSGTSVTLVGADQAAVRFRVPARRGTIGLRLTATDPAGRTAFAEAVVEVNNPPVVEPVAVPHVDIGQAFEVRLVAADPDGDALTFQLLEGPPGLTVMRDTGTIHWSRATEGVHGVRIRVSDGQGLAAPVVAFEIRVGQADSIAAPFSLSGNGGGGALPAWLIAAVLLVVFGRPRQRVRVRSRSRRSAP